MSNVRSLRSKIGRHLLVWLLPGLLALAVQVVYLSEADRDPTFLEPTIDAGRNHREALQIADGNPPSQTPYWQPPLYPYFLGAVYTSTGGTITTAKYVQAILGALSCILVALIGRRVFDSTVGMIGGLLFALYGVFIFYNLQLLASGLTVLLSLLVLLLTLRSVEVPSFPRWILTGLAFGAAALAFPAILLFGVAVGLWILGRIGFAERRWPTAVRSAIAVSLGVIVLIAPATLRNYRISGEFIPISYNGGYNFWIGNNLESEKTIAARPGFQSDRLLALPKQEGIRNASGLDRYFWSKGLAYARTHPGAFLQGLAEKAALYLNSRELPRNEDPYEYRDYSSLLSGLFWRWGPFGFPIGILLPLALLGILIGGWRTRERRFALAFALLYSLAIVLFFVSSRHRLPAMAVLMIFAAHACVWLWARVRHGEAGKILGSLGLVLLIGVFVNWPRAAPTDSIDFRAETQAALAANALGAGRLRQAEERYLRSLEIEPGVAETHTRLANIYQRTRQVPKAIRGYERAVELDPGLAEAHSRLGALYRDQGRLDRAIEHLRRAVEARPDDANTHRALGDMLATADSSGWRNAYREAWQLKHDEAERMPEPLEILLDRGIADAAVREGRRALEQDPDPSLAAKLFLSRALVQRAFEGNPRTWSVELREAASLCREALRENENHPVGQFTLARAMLGLGEKEEAGAAYQRALESDPDNVDLYVEMAASLLTMRDVSAAEEEIERALAIQPDHPVASRMMANYRATGRVR